MASEDDQTIEVVVGLMEGHYFDVTVNLSFVTHPVTAEGTGLPTDLIKSTLPSFDIHVAGVTVTLKSGYNNYCSFQAN